MRRPQTPATESSGNRGEYIAVPRLLQPSARRTRQTFHMRLVVLVACLTLVLGAASAKSSADRAPSLRLVDVFPVTFRGAGFARLEHVRVALTRNGRTTTRRVRSSRAGTFRVRFGLIALDPCRGAIVVRAAGGLGSRATYRRACHAPRP